MQQVEGKGSSRFLALFAFVIVVASVAAFSVGTELTSVTADRKQRQLQSLINSLTSENLDLQRQLASMTPSANVSLLGINPVRIYSESSPGIVTVQGVQQTPQGGTVVGSGFVTEFQGSEYIITNFHVVHGVTDISVTFFNGNSYAALVLGTDPYVDLAVLSLDAPMSEFHPLRIAVSSQLKVGEPVVAIGNPFGFSGSMTFGIISQTGRTLSESLAGTFAIAGVIQFSAPINPGNSGGPLLNANGSVVGITTAGIQSSQGVGFAIPSDVILRELPSLISTGRYDLHSFMGITGVDMSLQLARLQNTNVTFGLLIQNVTAGGPAAEAGLLGGTHHVVIHGLSYAIGGDLIVGMNGTKIVSTDALSSYLQEYTLPGQTIEVQLIRNGTAMTLDIVLGERPPAPSG